MKKKSELFECWLREYEFNTRIIRDQQRLLSQHVDWVNDNSSCLQLIERHAAIWKKLHQDVCKWHEVSSMDAATMSRSVEYAVVRLETEEGHTDLSFQPQPLPATSAESIDAESMGQTLFQPPSRGMIFIAFVVPADLRDALLGDLEEQFSKNCCRFGLHFAKCLFWRDVLGTFGSFVLRILKKPIYALAAVFGFDKIAN